LSVFSAVPPSAADRRTGGNWGVRRAVRLTFPQPSAQRSDPEFAARLDVYTADMLREYKLEQAPADRGGQAYNEMSRALIRRAVPPGEEVDVMVLAYAIPDISPGRSMTARLSDQCPGSPMSFGICDQGQAAPFTALRLLREYAHSGGLRRALLLVVEQAALPYDPGVPVAVPEEHSAVAFLLGDPPHASPLPVSTRLDTVVTAAGRPAESLEKEIRAACGGAGPVTLILGAAAAQAGAPVPAEAADRVRTAEAGRPYVGLWWELADELSRADGEPRRIVLCDYDPVQSCLCLAALDTGISDTRREYENIGMHY
jgi:4-hydroxymandelate oxidase